MKKLPLFKSHYSLGKSILTLDEPFDKKGQPVERSIINLVLANKMDTLTLVEDNMTSFLEASKRCNENKLKLIYGLRLEVTENISNQDESSLKKRAKYVIFAKNNSGYKALIKIWSLASKEGFYYNPCIDFKHLKKFWNNDLILAIPFYDSFLHLNSLESHVHVPEFETCIKPILFLEDNQLPFDKYLRGKVQEYAKNNGFEVLEVQSIFYRSKVDFIAYMTFRCIHNRTDIEDPKLDHFGSDLFNYEHWLSENSKI